jgi:hypothetical protein
MRQLLTLAYAQKLGCPAHVVEQALKQTDKPFTARCILHLEWDEADGYPRHAWGYQQWSVRPFIQGQGCDGTIDENVHLIGLAFCEQLGLDYAALYEEAYAEDREAGCGDWLRDYDERGRITNETIVPEISEHTVRMYLNDLQDINNRSLIEVMEREFHRLGFNVDQWWEEKAA